MNRFAIVFFTSLLSVSPAKANKIYPSEEIFIISNVVGIFYHELGHALIDLLDVPIGRRKEENAADAISILLVDQSFDEVSAGYIADDIAMSFSYDAEDYAPAFWSTHSRDEDRYHQTLCLFYGGDVDGRADFATETAMPLELRETCQEVRAKVDEKWGPLIEAATNEDKKQDWVYLRDDYYKSGTASSIMLKTVEEEVKFINKWIVLPQKLKVSVDDCGEANAFYDPETVEIILCTEYADHLAAQARQ